MANGRVLTGFSKPFVAVYTESNGAVTYSDGQILARGVSVSLEVESAADDNIFYADNVAAETVAGTFTGGTATLTVDGLLSAAEKLLYGLPTAGSDGFTAYGDDAQIPYVGIGFIARYMSDGVTSYTPYVLCKCRFNEISTSAATQEDQIDWQTQELTATIYRGDSAKHAWKKLGKTDYSTEDAAEAAIKTLFTIS